MKVSKKKKWPRVKGHVGILVVVSFLLLPGGRDFHSTVAVSHHIPRQTLGICRYASQGSLGYDLKSGGLVSRQARFIRTPKALAYICGALPIAGDVSMLGKIPKQTTFHQW